jgi:hypothetical protein
MTTEAAFENVPTHQPHIVVGVEKKKGEKEKKNVLTQQPHIEVVVEHKIVAWHTHSKKQKKSKKAVAGHTHSATSVP